MAPTARSTRSTKKAKVGEEVEREEIDIAPLSGALTKLPYETLVEVLSLCDPQSFARMLRTCKAITGLVQSEKVTLYRKLYHAHFFRNGFTINHILYSPRKQTSLVLFSGKENLPFNAIYNWQDQYSSMVQYNRIRNQYVCMSCLTSTAKQELKVVVEWKLRLCQICFARNLVVPSNLSIHQVTTKDVTGLSTVELTTQGMTGSFKQQKFYSALQLKSIAQEKHGEQYHGPQSLLIDENDKDQDREDLVNCSTLIHGGQEYGAYLAQATQAIQSSRQTGINLAKELENQATGKAFKKESGLKKRPLSDIITDYVDLVSEYIRTGPAVQEQGKIPYFLPAQNPGPLIPSDASVAAFSRIRRYFNDMRYNKNLFLNRTAARIQHFQDYVLKPNDSNWQKLVQFLREEDIMYPYRAPFITEDKEWTDISTHVTRMETEGGIPITDIQKSRIRLLAQIDAVTGGGSIGYNLTQLLPGKVLTGLMHNSNPIWWASAYYNNGVQTIELLRKVYKLSRASRIKTLKDSANLLIGGNKYGGTKLSVYLAIELLHCYIDGNNQRCDVSLRNRQKVEPYSRYQDEIVELIGLMRSSILNSTNIIATVHKFGRCSCYGRSTANCRGECWITYLSSRGEQYWDSD